MDPATAAFLSYRRTGDLEALGRTFDLVAPRLLALALHLCGRAHDAEDALQAAFVVAMQKHAAFDARQPVGPWLAGILAGEARNLLRRERRRRGERVGEAVGNGAAEAADVDPAAVAENRELVAELRTHIEELPAEQRQVLLLQLQYGLQPAEIAEVLGIAPGAVRMRLHRGLQTLRGVLPAGLAAAIASSLPSQAFPDAGLQPLREVVLQHARVGGPWSVGAGTGVVLAAAAGGLGMKKVLFAAVLLLALLGAWQWFAAPGADAPGTAPTATPIAIATPLQAPSAAPAGGQATDRGERAAVALDPAPRTGAIRIHVRGDEMHEVPGGEEAVGSAGSGTPLCGIPVELVPADPGHGVRRVVTGADGTAVVQDLPSGDWKARTAQPREGAVQHDCRVIASGEVAIELHLAVRSLRGRVVDPAGRPIGGAEVWLGQQFPIVEIAARPQPPARQTATTASDGTFTVVHLGSEELVSARKAGFAASRSQPTFVLPGSVTLVLEPNPASLLVTVAAAEGPLPDDLLVLASRDGGRRRDVNGDWLEPPLPVQGQRVDGGTFAVHGLLPGVHTAIVQSRGLWAQARVMVAPERPTSVTLVLSTGMNVRGRIVDAGGAPQAGLHVSVRRDDGSWRSAVTVADGTFELLHEARQPLVLHVQRLASGMRAEHRYDPPGRGDLQCEIVFDEPASLAGRLEGPAGTARTGWRVGFRADADGRESAAEVDGDGSFVLHGVGAAAGTLTFERSSAGQLRASFSRRRTEGEPGPLAIAVPAAAVPTASLRGRVVAGGGALLPDCVVSLDDEPPLPPGAASFAFQGLDAGQHTLHLAARGHVSLRRSIELTAGQELDLGDMSLAPGCELRLRFLRPDGSPWRDRPPIPRLQNGAGETGHDHTFATEVDGTVVARGLSAGRWRVAPIEQDELLFESFEVELRAEAPREHTVPTAVGRRCQLVLGDPAAIPDRQPLAFEVRRADGLVVWSCSLQRQGARLLPLDRDLDAPFACTLPLDTLRAELRGPAGISHAVEFVVRPEQESPLRVVVPRR